jgi:hypothetical protein
MVVECDLLKILYYLEIEIYPFHMTKNKLPMAMKKGKRGL